MGRKWGWWQNLQVWAAGTYETVWPHQIHAACGPVHWSPPSPPAPAGCRWHGCEGDVRPEMKQHITVEAKCWHYTGDSCAPVRVVDSTHKPLLNRVESKATHLINFPLDVLVSFNLSQLLLMLSSTVISTATDLLHLLNVCFPCCHGPAPWNFLCIDFHSLIPTLIYYCELLIIIIPYSSSPICLSSCNIFILLRLRFFQKGTVKTSQTLNWSCSIWSFLLPVSLSAS